VKIRISELRTYSRFARQHARRFLGEQWRESRRPIPPAPFHPDPQSWSDERLTVTWLGHATVLMNFYGTWLLTDPALRPNVGVNLGAVTVGPRRLVAPALTTRELPPLDAVLVSHAHMDHCDMGTLRALPRNLRVVTQAHNRDLFRRFREVNDLAWGDSVSVNGATIEAIEVNHWGARKLTDRHRGYGGFLIRKNGHAVVFGGDTAYTQAFGRLRNRAEIDLAIMPIGAYDPYVFAHASPEHSWTMSRDMGARYILPMHHSTFRLSREPVNEPIKRLFAIADTEAWRIALTSQGQTWTLPENGEEDKPHAQAGVEIQLA
jgi:L-ascorbate metabolism protein UlaG (beta-lactamase superfamily)